MASTSRRTSRPPRRASSTVRAAATPLVATWEEDPGDPAVQPRLTPITVPAPAVGAQPMPSRIRGTAPAARVYQTGSSQFRYYAAATSLRRTADFWGSMLATVPRWQVGSVLPVTLDAGVELNAYYTRGGFGDSPGLHFFHQAVSGRTYFSGESPDVVCHEMGHAILDALRPQLYDAQSVEVAAFHESFGDMTALLSSLQVGSFRAAVLRDTGGILNRSSRLSRLAEQLGAAIRVQHPDAVDRDCLRNAANSFFYRDPQTLPPMAPASGLSSEPHSFSRVFTAAFLDVLAGMFRARGAAAGSSDLLACSQDIARLLAGAVREAPVVPDYFSQIAAHMLDVGERAPWNGKYREILKGVFVRRGIVSLNGAQTILITRRAKAAPAAAPAFEELPMATISGAQYGLSELVLKVFTAEEPKRFAVTSSSLVLVAVEPRSAQNAAESFTEDLFQRGRVDVGQYGYQQAGLVHPYTPKTHAITRERGELVLRRRTFDCGFAV